MHEVSEGELTYQYSISTVDIIYKNIEIRNYQDTIEFYFKLNIEFYMNEILLLII